jgi:hypothetical protein
MRGWPCRLRVGRHDRLRRVPLEASPRSCRRPQPNRGSVSFVGYLLPPTIGRGLVFDAERKPVLCRLLSGDSVSFVGYPAAPHKDATRSFRSWCESPSITQRPSRAHRYSSPVERFDASVRFGASDSMRKERTAYEVLMMGARSPGAGRARSAGVRSPRTLPRRPLLVSC